MTDADRLRFLAVSDARDRELQSWLWAWQNGWECGYGHGYRAGRGDEHAEAAARWQDAAATIKASIPDTPEFKASVERRLAAALAGERRDEAEHERQFVAQCFATPEPLLSEIQAAALRLWGRR